MQGERLGSSVESLSELFSKLRPPTVTMATAAQVTELIQTHTAPLRETIERLTRQLTQLTNINDIQEYTAQRVDDNVRCDEPLDVIKSLPSFNGKISYVSWREAANNSMSLYTKNSRKYYAALTILRNKVTEDANDILTNHGTVLNLDAILSRLDFAYADKRPPHIIEQELSVMRQGSLTIIDYYNEINKKLTALINKTIMTHGPNIVLTNELNKKNRQYALRVFITGLNPPLANILFSLSPSDLPNALAKAQELESNNLRATFAQQYSRNNYNTQKYNNSLRFPQRNLQNHNSQNHHQPKPEPMELGSSSNVVRKPQQHVNQKPNFNNRPNYPNSGAYQQNTTASNNKNNNYNQQGFKRQYESAQLSYQPNQKEQRINNIGEDAFLDTSRVSPTLSNQETQDADIQF